MTPPPIPKARPKQGVLDRYFGVFQYTGRAVRLVWETNRPLLYVFGSLTVVAGLLPAGIAWVGKLIVDAVVLAVETGAVVDQEQALIWVALEGGLVLTMVGIQRGISVCENLLRAQLGHRVNMMILDKSLQLDLTQFEDAGLYDKMTRARREASSRPLSLVRRSFGLVQNTISLVSYAAILLAFSPLAVLLLVVGAIPAFAAEVKFSRAAFRLFSWKTPEKRKQNYLEIVVSREDYAKEVQLLELGPTLVGRYDRIFWDLYADDRVLTLKRGFWGYALGLLGILALYGAYGWIVLATVAATITLGQMTMYLMVFKQGQSAFSAILTAVGGMYEDNLYLSTLYEFLGVPEAERRGNATEGPDPTDGIRFEGVAFTYPGSTEPALQGIDLHIPPGRKLALVGHNGSGKTTLIKLLARLYTPTQGRILLDGRDLQEWDISALRARIGVIFQDFVKYQFQVGENIRVGDVPRMDDTPGMVAAAEKGMAKDFIEAMPEGYETQLGRWFENGRELSIGQWQKVALARAFMRTDASILVLDEPTSAMDAEAEAEIFTRLAALTQDQIAVLISHRFSTVRMADHIVVLHGGRLVEAGTHPELMALNGQYAHLFTLQAEGYR